MVTCRSIERSIWRRARWLVLAPHPDDETLGAGALIHQAATDGCLAGVAYLTDGTGSHPPGTPRLASARRTEARTALHRLAGRAVRIDWLGWQDAHPLAVAGAPFERDARRIGAMLRDRRVDALAVTDRLEPHCDHEAAFHLAVAAARSARRAIAVFTYSVWSVPPAGRCGVRTRPLAVGQRRRALQAHRSQLSPSHGAGFRLPRDKTRMAAFDTLTLRSQPR